MRLTEIFRLVWLNVTQNKFKMALTSVGIIAGAATIVLVIAIGRGGQADVADQFKNLNAGAIDITYKYSGNSGAGGGGFGGSGGGGMPGRNMGGFGGGGMFFGGFSMENTERIELSETDVEELELFIPGLTAATISASGSSTVTGGDLEEEASYTIAGVKSSYADVSNLSLSIGDFISDQDDEELSKTAVLGCDAAEDIFGSAYSAFGSIIYIDERSYTVIGVLEKMGSVSSGISPDTSIFIPYQTARKYVFGAGNISPQITVVAENVKEVAEVIDNIEVVLGQSYPNASFTITDAGSKMEAASKSSDTLTILLYAVAAIVFLIGGIGIMNVLFVSVKERTKEIGVLKALGSSQKDILTEFLMEAAMISVFGGVVGVMLASACMPLASTVGMRVEPSAQGIVLALSFAIVTGTVFGFYPAFKASRLLPVEALKE